MVKMFEKKYFYIEDLVKILRASDFTVREYLKANKLRGRKIAGKWLVEEKDLKDFIEKGVQK